MNQTAEQNRLDEANKGASAWRRWGPYISERAWGTVREDYSADGAAWDYLPHDQARSKAYRWNEDGIAGFSDRKNRICIALSLWNENDPILKERMFGLAGPQGNHGEDVKEYFYYLDSTPTHSYAKCLYKYPQKAYPYSDLVQTNGGRDKHQPEYELIDTGIFDSNEYFDVFVEYAKASPNDILARITIHNRAAHDAPVRVIPTVWFRNNWTWYENPKRPSMEARQGATGIVDAHHPEMGDYEIFAEGECELLFTENETNNERLYQEPNANKYAKDGINDYIVNGKTDTVNPAHTGTKFGAHYRLNIPAGGSATVKVRLRGKADSADGEPFDGRFDTTFATRISEADEFYAGVIPTTLPEDDRSIMRQAMAGMMWCKQYYRYVVREWLKGDPTMPPPPPQRLNGRNSEWGHVYSSDVLSMPDSWEYPWFAAWDLAFHCIPISLIDSEFAKKQLVLLTREWYMSPSGQLPAYEWAFGDVNPPVHAWSAFRVYQIDAKQRGGKPDRLFLERVFQKLMLNFTWWVNRKDRQGNNIFEGGFLGLDNIGIFDRSQPLPNGGFIEQSDGTSWMAMYALNLMNIAIELAQHDRAYEDIASKFWEHFLYIAAAINGTDGKTFSLYDETDGFFYDVLNLSDGSRVPMKFRSAVGLIPLFAVQTIEQSQLDTMKGFTRRMNWFIDNRKDLTQNVASMRERGKNERLLLSIMDVTQLRSVLKYMLDEDEFLSPHGIRSVSKIYDGNPYCLTLNGETYSIDYEPAESTTGLFGGNSNWRGPVWMPINYLIIESLQKYHYYLGDEFKVEFPTRSGNMMTLWDVSQELSKRLSSIFQRDEQTGLRPVHGGVDKFQHDPNFNEYVWFYEYFNGDNGAGVGASHQTGWTGLVAKLMQQTGEYDQRPPSA